MHSDIVAPYITNYGTEEQKQRILPKVSEPSEPRPSAHNATRTRYPYTLPVPFSTAQHLPTASRISTSTRSIASPIPTNYLTPPRQLQSSSRASGSVPSA